MATERDFELLDDYLANKLDARDKSAFEQKLESDPDLKKEMEFQQQLVKSIRNERASALKAMLNNVTVPAASGTGSSVTTKISVTLVIATVAGLGIYLLLNNNESGTLTRTSQEQPVTQQPAEDTPVTTQPQETPSDITAADIREESHKEDAQSDKKKEPAINTIRKKNDRTDSQAAQQPKLDVFDPSGELKEQDVEENSPVTDAEDAQETIASSSIVIETDNTNKKYNFHYQFKEGRLLLYGSFDKNLIEILEFFTDNKHTIFLFFNSNYYLLDEQQAKPALLKPITDPVLLKKLKEYRSK